jgi:hypothetical protein
MQLILALSVLIACDDSASTPAPTPAPAPAPAPEPAAAPVSVSGITDTDAIMGCGCAVVAPIGDRIFLFGSLLGESEGWMNLDGADRKLTRQGEEPSGQERGAETFAGDGYTVTVTWSNPRGCAHGDEGCESTDYDATLRVTRDGAPESTLTEVTGPGSCGC